MSKRSLDPRSFHPDGIATLELTQGETSAKLSEILRSYEYEQDKDDRHFWRLSANMGSGLLFNEDNTVVVIVGSNEDNMDNSNYVLSSAGWNNLIIHSIDIKSEEKVVEMMTTLLVSHMERHWDEDSADGSTPEANAIEHFVAAPSVSTSESMSATDSPAPKYETENVLEFSQEKAPMAPTLLPPAHPEPGFPRARSVQQSDPLLRVIEEHVLNSLLPSPSNPIVSALKAAGYEVRVVLQPC